MKLAADLHIHSCLSPCGDAAMTPNNIVGMAAVKGLDVIAVADHNTALNLPAVKAVADAYGLVLLPAIEAESREEVHILLYFPTVEAALEMGEIIYSALPDNPNIPSFFGEQHIMNEDDEVTGSLGKLLIQASDLSLEELAEKCRALGGEPVPAHINRSSNSLIANLGFMPEEPVFSSVEVYRSLTTPGYVDLSSYHVLYSSDAHDLGAIFERDNFIPSDERSAKGILEYLRAPKTV